VRVAAKNEISGLVYDELKDSSRKGDTPANGKTRVEIRVLNRPDILLEGDVYQKASSGKRDLPHPSLGYNLGGEIDTSPDDAQGMQATENFFEVRIGNLRVIEPKELRERFEQTGDITLLPGQRVVVRFEFVPKPLASQAWTKLRQVFQKSFQM
jgi:hypothetical protein